MREHVGIEELLAWYRDAGVDEPLADLPIDRFEESSKTELIARARPALVPAVALADTKPEVPRAVSTLSADMAAREAVDVAANCGDLAALSIAIRSFEGCGLKSTARTTIFAKGDPTAPLAIVGDVPNRDEDAEGEPFAGPAGEMLERMLNAIGTSRNETYRLLASPWRTPGQRALNPREKAVLAPFMRRHVELLRPSLLLVLGGAATEFSFGAGKRLPAMRGKWQQATFGEQSCPTICTFHPDFLIHQPEQKRLAWHDLLLLQKELGTSRARTEGTSQSGIASRTDGG